METFWNDPNALNNSNLSQDEEGDQEINIRNILREFDQLFVNPQDSEEEDEPEERDLGTFFQNPDPLNIPLPESEDTAQESEDEDMAQNNRKNNNNNNNGNNIFNDGQFQTWMQMITQAVNNVANPQVNQKILNIVKVNEYYGTDTEDSYEWIQSVEKAVQANN